MRVEGRCGCVELSVPESPSAGSAPGPEVSFMLSSRALLDHKKISMYKYCSRQMIMAINATSSRNGFDDNDNQQR